jgi:hypothetical protein
MHITSTTATATTALTKLFSTETLYITNSSYNTLKPVLIIISNFLNLMMMYMTNK